MSRSPLWFRFTFWMRLEMPRYYYPASRAHHAYVMAKDFGMEFERRFGKWEPEALLHLTGGSEYRIYVHAESLDLLEIRIGDLLDVVHPNGTGSLYEKKFQLVADEGVRLTIENNWKLRYPDVEYRIIQRQGIAFSMPEVEP